MRSEKLSGEINIEKQRKVEENAMEMHRNLHTIEIIVYDDKENLHHIQKTLYI